jgi:hypothetical protein
MGGSAENVRETSCKNVTYIGLNKQGPVEVLCDHGSELLVQLKMCKCSRNTVLNSKFSLFCSL